jgi:hypothetical protein
MPRKNSKEEKEYKEFVDNYPSYRPTPLYAILFCGLFILIAGIYFKVNNAIEIGSIPNGRYSSSSRTTVLNGPFLILLGTALSAFPLYVFYKQKRKTKK